MRVLLVLIAATSLSLLLLFELFELLRIQVTACRAGPWERALHAYRTGFPMVSCARAVTELGSVLFAWAAASSLAMTLAPLVRRRLSPPARRR